MTRRIVVGIAVGIAWGVLASAVFVAMLRGLLPAPSEVATPVTIGLIFAYVPFLVAAGLEALIGRGSASLAETLAATIASGMAIGAVVGSLTSLAWRGHK